MNMMDLFLAADAAPQTTGPTGIDLFKQMFPWLLFIFAFYYLFVAMPMRKQKKQFADLMAAMKAGDRVVTNSGMYGVVTGITDNIVKLRIANNVVVEIDKSAISRLVSEGKEEKKEEKK